MRLSEIISTYWDGIDYRSEWDRIVRVLYPPRSMPSSLFPFPPRFRYRHFQKEKTRNGASWNGYVCQVYIWPDRDIKNMLPILSHILIFQEKALKSPTEWESKKYPIPIRVDSKSYLHDLLQAAYTHDGVDDDGSLTEFGENVARAWSSTDIEERMVLADWLSNRGYPQSKRLSANIQIQIDYALSKELNSPVP